MKKIFSISIALLSLCLQGFPQHYLKVYRDNVVVNQISTSDIDSLSVTEGEPHVVSLWRNGEVFLSYNSGDVDSIKVSSQGRAPLSYIGVVGFNDDLYVKDIGILSSYTAGEYKTFVSNLPRRDGTLLYYAVDNALDMLDNALIDTPLSSVNLVTFTDGLDQGSLMMTDNYESSIDYLDAMSSRIAATTVGGIPLNAFSVGLRGNDVTNVALYQQNLQRLASSPGNAFEVSSISGLRSKFNDIANQIVSVSTRQTMSVKIPGIDSGSLVRFVFDGRPAESSQLYIEGTFNLKDRSLHNVSYHGLLASSGTTVQGTQSGIFVTYTFTGMRLASGDGLVPTASVKHYYRTPSASSWQVNSEFSPASNSQTSVSHSGTSIFLILDCSNSLGSDFSNVKQYANEFIDMVASNAEPFRLVAPTNVTASLDADALFVNVSWDAVKYAKSYKVYRSKSSNGTYELLAADVTSTSWTDESPLVGSNYYKVCAVGYGFTSSNSSYASINVQLDAPTNVTASLDADALFVNVSWDAVKYAQSYKVYRSKSSNGTYELLAADVTSTSWTDESPLVGSNCYKVCAVGYGIESAMSTAVMVRDLGPLPSDGIVTVNGVSFRMVRVSGGTFQMGATAEQGSDAFDSEKPVHSVTLSDFAIGETEVTQALWQAVMGSNPSCFTGDLQRPVETVSWNDCQAFITKLNELTGLSFRLPTEAEWEFAARGGNSSLGYKYAGSNTLGDVAWYGDNSSSTHAVGTKSPNELSLYDMSGNVWEWCQDWYGNYSSAAQTNPTGPASGSYRVNRGGSWCHYARGCRVADRYYYTPSYGNYPLGLRLAF